MIPPDDVKRAVAAAVLLRSQGYFERAAHGDERAASLFARLVAYTANPEGLTSGWGALRKTGSGFNVDGYADGAIVFGNDPQDLHNVLKIVTQVGSDHAGIGDADQERRPADVWERPHALTDEQRAYLLAGGMPIAAPPAAAPALLSYEALGGDEGAKKITRVLGHDYRFAGRPGLDDECGGWLRRTDYDRLAGICATEEASIAKHRDEWLAALGLIVSTPGMMSDSDQCKICGASVGYERGKKRPIPHTAECTTR